MGLGYRNFSWCPDLSITKQLPHYTSCEVRLMDQDLNVYKIRCFQSLKSNFTMYLHPPGCKCI